MIFSRHVPYNSTFMSASTPHACSREGAHFNSAQQTEQRSTACTGSAAPGWAPSMSVRDSPAAALCPACTFMPYQPSRFF